MFDGLGYYSQVTKLCEVGGLRVYGLANETTVDGASSTDTVNSGSLTQGIQRLCLGGDI